MIIDDEEEEPEGRVGGMTIADLCCSTEALKIEADVELIEYNSNNFWKADVIDVDELEELD